MEGKKGKIVLQVRGYPLPTIHWYLNDEKLDYGDNYNGLLSPSGTVTLEIKLVTADTIGTYKCFAENESGSAVKYVKYEFAGIAKFGFQLIVLAYTVYSRYLDFGYLE